MIFNRKNEIKPENDYPGIRNIRKKRKADCVNYFFDEQQTIERIQNEKRSRQRSETMQEWFKRKMENLVDSSLEFFDDREVHYGEEKNES